jgi:DNA-binding XRE family transcriptional regulator
MTPLNELKTKMLAQTATREAYDALGDEFELAHQLIEARTRAHLTQTDVAQRMGTTQSVIARLEGGKQPPSLRTMQRYAQAVGGRLVLRIEPTV